LGKKTESRGRMLLADSFVDLILSGILVSKKGKVKKKKKKNHFTVIASLLDYAHIYTS
jgi:ribosomal protein L11 methylase PrmA